jgi:hypothetical protein
MFAMVARTALIGRIPCRIPAAGSQAARVTHTLLFLAAQIALLSPGVCDACVKGCCASGTPRIADVASPILASNLPSSTVVGGCGSDHCCGLPVADPITEKATADRGTADVTAACGCELLPRQIPPASLESGGFSGRREIVRSWASVDAALPVAWLPPLNGRNDGLQSLAFAQESAATIPSRPVRVLYGVWRN